MTNPLISVIITTFKRDARYLKRSILSVLNQTFTDYELIIVDDNGENTKYSEIVEKTVQELGVSNYIKLIKNPKNLGPQKSRNIGIENSLGKFIAFLDDDDEWLERKLELQYEKFKNTEDDKLGLVYCWYNILTEDNNNQIKKKVMKPSIKHSGISRELLRNNFIGSTSFPLIKKECFIKVGMFDEQLPAKQDYDMWIRICNYYSIDYVAEPLCNYYSHRNERITTNIQKKLDAEKRFLKKHYSLIKKDRKALAIKNFLIGRYYLKLNNFINSRQYFWKSIILYPFKFKTYIFFVISLFQYKPKLLKNKI